MKVNIIGAGVAGLSAGCYLQASGFETEIFERHSMSGGLCTSWQRGGYTFESGLQWLLGSGERNPFYQLWSELIDMKAIRFVHHETRMDVEVRNSTDINGDKVFHLYTDLDRLEKYLLSIAPEDRVPLGRLIRSMRKIQAFEIPPMIREVPELLPWKQKSRFIKYLPLLFFLNRIKKETNISFAAKLKNPFLKEAFLQLFDGNEQSLMIHTIPLAFNDLKSTGYPCGGGAAFAGLLERRYISLGGRIRFNTAVDRILHDGRRATGIRLASGEEVPSDVTVSAADWNFTVFTALGGAFVDRTIMKLSRRELLEVYFSVFTVSMGVDGTYEDYPVFMRFPLDPALVSPDGTRYDWMEVHINNYDPSSAPPGKTAVSVCLYTKNGGYWIDLRNSDREQYNVIKTEFAGRVIEKAATRLAGLREKIEVTDIATPATFQRYTGNWNGSIQGWLPGKNIIARSPVKNELPGLQDFWFAGHWTIPGGGLPVAIKSARDAAKIICHRKKVKFGF